MIQHARNGVGVACFGTSPDNPTLWQRYGADGAGVCVEFDVPDLLLGSQLHRVVYNDERRIHIDDFLRSRFDLSYGAVIYASLLTKTKFWVRATRLPLRSRAHGAQQEDGHSGRQAAWLESRSPGTSTSVPRNTDCIDAPVDHFGADGFRVEHDLGFELG